ncbi:MAG: Cu(I)-responsive transcriptional regulator [Pseudomonadota bacterium]
MNIQQASEQSDLSVKTVRYYDEIKLVEPARLSNGYRDYSENDVHKLKFLNRAKCLGFSLDDCRQLLSLYEDKNRSSASVKKIAKSKIKEIELKLAELDSMRKTLTVLVNSCSGDDRPECPILEELGKHPPKQN